MTMDAKNRVIKNGAVMIQDNTILEVGISAELVPKYSNSDQIIDANGRVVMPGFICGHMHFYSAFATGMSLPPFPKGFGNVLKYLWWKIDKALLKDDIYYSALLGYIQAVKHGTTTIVDHHASPSYIAGSLDLIEKAAREIGVRSSLCYEITDRNSSEEAKSGIKENERFIKKCQQTEDDLVNGLVGLHASFTLSDESLAQANQLITDYNTGVHIHVAEGPDDGEHAKDKFQSTVVQRLQKHKLLNQHSIMAHCIYLEEADYAILKNSKANIVHQPRSNMNNAVGTLDIWKLLEYKIPFGLGTDGMSTDMKAELMVAPLLQKHTQQDNTIGTVEVYDAMFKQNPQIIQNVMGGVKTGSLESNRKADVIITNYYPRSPITSDNTIGHAIFGVLNETIATTIIDGRVCMENGIVPDIDEAAIARKCQELAPEVWNRIE